MTTATIVSLAADYAKEAVGSNDASHDWTHLERVLATARSIAREEQERGAELDFELIELAALLHDVADRKYLKDGETEQEAIDRLLNFLRTNGWSDEVRLKKLSDIILGISFKKSLTDGAVATPKPIELLIVQDADRLDAIGAIGIARCLTYGGAKNRSLYNEHTPDLNDWVSQGCPMASAEVYSRSNEMTIDHFYHKLLHLKRLMNTESAKRKAEARHEFMIEFLQQFFQEVKGNK
eukprot:TRINITY_DN3166_c0_g1_i1.p1 TRINITY_DN3166_c0_g1~~TRINITY_DN3166_c0_g1_i1.p1  ORF type:complete len:237 (-),score=70.10 TRINITY_DN3166_c0_g1_i1:31-741(-)